MLVEAVAQALVNSQAEAHLGAPWNARGMERSNGYRNDYKPRGFQTVVGALDLSIPQARNGGFLPTLFDRWQRSERALLAACGEMVLAGVSNRNVSKLTEEAFGAEVSPSLVSQLLKDLEPAVEAFLPDPTSGDLPLLQALMAPTQALWSVLGHGKPVDYAARKCPAGLPTSFPQPRATPGDRCAVLHTPHSG